MNKSAVIITTFGLILNLSLHGQFSSFLLTGSQETALNPTGSAGYATTSLSGNDLTYSIYHTGTSGLTGAHFHGPASAGTNAGVQVALTAGPSPITGTATLTTGQLADFNSGLFYLNLHTSENPGGELRGQAVSQLSFTPNNIISGSQVTGGMAVAGGGAALVTFNPGTLELSWNIAYEGLTGAATAMHFHGPAALGTNAGVLVDIGSISGLSSESNGSTVITSGQATDLLAGEWYINIHTATNPSGEIRGQILNVTTVPEPATYATLLGLVGLGLILVRRRKRG